jgi:hypothetical protein
MMSYQLSFPLVLKDSLTAKDGGDGLRGVLEDWALGWASTLVIIGIIIATWLLGCLIGERCLQTSTLPNGLLGVFVDRAWAIHELGEVGFIGALGVNIGGVDGVVESAPPSLSTSYEVITSWFMVIVTTVAIIMVPIIVMFFIVASVTQASDTFSFFCIHVTIGHVD